MPQDSNEKKIDKAALELANNAMQGRIFDALTADEVADYCVAVAKKIIETSSDD